MNPIANTAAADRTASAIEAGARRPTPPAEVPAPLRAPTPIQSHRRHAPALDDVVGGFTLAAMLCLVCTLIVDGFASGLVA